MKKTSILVTAVLCGAIASLSFTTANAKPRKRKALSEGGQFDTIAKASQHCPIPGADAFIFTAQNTTSNSAGVITSTAKSSDVPPNFSSTDKSIAAPANLNNADAITDIAWRQTSSGYGYTSGDITTCFYEYAQAVNPSTQVSLIMNNQNSSLATMHKRR